MDHAVGALGIAGFRPVVRPVGRLDQFLEGVGVAILQEITGLLPAEDAVSGHTPWGTGELAFTHEELHVHGRGVELPALLAVGEDAAEEAAGTGAAEEVPLVGGLLVGVSRRDHHALDANLHQLVKESADRVRVCSIEESGVGGDAEASGYRSLDALERDVVSAFAADGEVVVLALAVEVDGERQIFAGLKEVKSFFK